MGWWSEIWTRRAEDWVCGWIYPPRAPAEPAPRELDPKSQCYLSVLLKSARVVNVRKALKTFYGTVHSYIRVPHRSHGLAEFNVVTTPAALKNADATGIDRVVQLNHRLLGPIPYVGGDVEVELGLFSVASSDLAAPYLDLMEALSRSAGVSYVAAAVPFAGPILQGMKLLTGTDKDIMLEIGLSMALSPPRLGYCVAVRAPKSSLALAEVQIDPADFKLLRNGEPIAEFPYLVLEFSADVRRAEWFLIPELAAAYKLVQGGYRAGRKSDAEDALAAFRRVALTCNDLHFGDAQALVGNVEQQYAMLGPPPSVVRRGDAQRQSFPDLVDIDLYSA
jgi:hypothetical protein